MCFIFSIIYDVPFVRMKIIEKDVIAYLLYHLDTDKKSLRVTSPFIINLVFREQITKSGSK